MNHMPLQARHSTDCAPRPTNTHNHAACGSPAALGGFAPSSASLKWDSCLGAGRMLVWHGIRCGDMRSVQWTGVYVANTADNKAVPGCYTSITSPNYAVGTDLGNAVFGRCGVAPSKAPT